ncbi:MAG: translation elongation factor Ts [Rikenellaceae bacterium]|nr:translation elongation factor Ts [Rikenellaceae bacterium]MCL2692508.1 translation elongation factor Ts [Rikenellaceae bacterium]
MQITAADVAKLRKMTGAGMMDCKNALAESNGDFERAQDIIREKGKLVSAKRADRTATEGAVVARVVGGKAYMLCLACETDFVAKNEEFIKSAEQILDAAIATDAGSMEQLLAAKVGGVTVADAVAEKSGQTGEKVELPYYGRIEAPMVITYVHSNRKLGAMVGFNREIPRDNAYDVVMQAAAMAPVSISETDVAAEIIERERNIGREQARLEGKPENMLDQIAEGKVKKFLKENTLLNQAFVKDPKMTVAEYIKSADKDATVVAFQRFSLND